MNDYTHITYVLDRSGSMSTVQKDVAGGLTSYIAEQKILPGKCTFSLVQFDDQYNVEYWFKDIKEVETIDFVPRGWTAMLDAIGKAINSTGEALALMPEADRPDKVLMIIHTDGEENASKEFRRSQINDLIKHQETKYNWKFVFVGTNIDVVATGGDIGVSRGSTKAYDNTSRGINVMYSSLSNATAKARSHIDLAGWQGSFFADDQTVATGTIAVTADDVAKATPTA